MSLEKILAVLEAEAGQQVAEVAAATRAEVERLRSLGRQEVETVQQRHLRAMSTRLAATRTELLNQAKREALYLITDTREKLIDSVLAAAAARVVSLSGTPAYRRWLRLLIIEAVTALGRAEGLRLQVCPEDLASVEEIVREMNLPAIVEATDGDADEPSASAPGVVAVSPDGRIRLVNTLPARIRRAATYYRAQIADHLFDAKPEA